MASSGGVDTHHQHARGERSRLVTRARQALRAWLERHPSDVEVLVADARLSEPAELGIVGRPTRPGASVLVASSLG